jgi:uncharacterized membrane protein (UPF0127 family)
MILYSLKIDDKKFRVAVVSDEEAMRKGLSGPKKLKKGYGMLFDFKVSQKVTMTMKEMQHSIDMLFIDDSMKVIKAIGITPKAKDITVDNVRFVLEVNLGEGKGTLNKELKVCDRLKELLDLHADNNKNKTLDKALDKPVTSSTNIIIRIETTPINMKEKFKRGGVIKIYEEDIKADRSKMQVLDDTGKVLMNIAGGERIFSIEHTNQLVELAQKVELGEATEEELGKLLADIIDIQNNQEAEYV